MSAPIDRLDHFVRAPVGLPDGSTGRFLVDTGIGVSVVAPSVAGRLGLALTGRRVTGRRMSGQEISADTYGLSRLEVAGHVVRDAEVAVMDLDPRDEPAFDGILGLDLLGVPGLWVDPGAGELGVGPLPAWDTVPVEVRREAGTVCVFVELVLPSGRTVVVEVDTGSDALVLDPRFLDDCGLQESDITERARGTDETGHPYERWFATAHGEISLAHLPGARQAEPPVMFQPIIHDGLLGAAFLDRFRYGVDTARGILAVSSPSTRVS